MSEEEIINILSDEIVSLNVGHEKYEEAVKGLLDLYQKEKEKNKKLEIELEIKKYCKVDELSNDLIYYKNLAKEYQGNCISKDKIRDKQIEREFELQQEYKDFEDDIQWKTYKELLEEN